MNELQKAMSQAKASIELEGIKIKAEYSLLVKAVLNKKISEEEFQKKVKKLLK